MAPTARMTTTHAGPRDGFKRGMLGSDARFCLSFDG
jgi:hypothetical protein